MQHIFLLIWSHLRLKGVHEFLALRGELRAAELYIYTYIHVIICIRYIYMQHIFLLIWSHLRLKGVHEFLALRGELRAAERGVALALALGDVRDAAVGQPEEQVNLVHLLLELRKARLNGGKRTG